MLSKGVSLSNRRNQYAEVESGHIYYEKHVFEHKDEVKINQVYSWKVRDQKQALSRCVGCSEHGRLFSFDNEQKTYKVFLETHGG